MRASKIAIAAVAAAIVAAAGVWFVSGRTQDESPSGKDAKAQTRSALTVTPISLQPAEWPQVLPANGNIAAWQEAIIGSEISGQRLTEVLANVGDRVKKGQVLARVDDDTIEAELAQSKAALAEAQAMAAKRSPTPTARQMGPLGAFAKRQINQYLTMPRPRRRASSRRARVQADDRLAHTRGFARRGRDLGAHRAVLAASRGANPPDPRRAAGGAPRSPPPSSAASAPASPCMSCRPARPRARASPERCAWWRRPSIRRRATAWSMSTCRPPVLRAPACSHAASSRSAAAPG
jgi:hypothetical protein